MSVLVFVSLVALVSSTCRCGSKWFLPQTETYVPQVRVYDLTAVEVDWNYAPLQTNAFQNRNFTAHELEYTAKSVYRKCIYVDTHGAIPNDGLLGPPLRALVGDSVRVTLRNNCSFTISLHVHGFQYTKDNEGASSAGVRSAGDVIDVGGVFAYEFDVPESAGPLGDDDASTVLWAYHSHVEPTKDESTGLVGSIVVGRPSHCDWRTAVPLDVDTEIFSLWTVVDESQSRLAAANNVTPLSHDEEHLKHSVNGFLFANQAPFVTRVGHVARWYLIAFGDERDIHSVHWHGATVVEQHRRTDVVPLFAAVFRVADMVPHVAGLWPLHCHLLDHMSAGMSTFFRVLNNSAAALCEGKQGRITECLDDLLTDIDCASGVATLADAASASSLCATPATSVLVVLLGIAVLIAVVVVVGIYAIWTVRTRRNGGLAAH
jgi:hypothetical protein